MSFEAMIESEQNGCYIVYERVIGAWVGYVIDGAGECTKSENKRPQATCVFSCKVYYNNG